MRYVEEGKPESGSGAAAADAGGQTAAAGTAADTAAATGAGAVAGAADAVVQPQVMPCSILHPVQVQCRASFNQCRGSVLIRRRWRQRRRRRRRLQQIASAVCASNTAVSYRRFGMLL